jgi:16S rRNA (cytidine1402-2'-O)-methyltransferase
MEAALYLVATPIGNLGDLTVRAIDVLKSVDLVACEDTRTSRKLLDHHGIATPTVSHHAHSDPKEAEALLDRIAKGAAIALISDAGTPLLSDPGWELVARARARGLSVVPIPGPSALLAAVTASGLPTHRITFLGFLPKGAADQREIVAPLATLDHTIVIYESPRRLGETLRTLSVILGDRSAAVARELTKQFETFELGSLSDLAVRFDVPPRGEVVIVVGPPSAAPSEDVDLGSKARELVRSGTRPTDAARALAARFGIAKRQAYDLVMAAKSEAVEDERRPLEEIVLERLRAYVVALEDHRPESLYDLIMPQFERPLIRVAMEIAGGRQVQAAEMLGIHRNTLRTRLRALGLEDPPDE